MSEENKNKNRIYLLLIILLLISFGISLFFINKQSNTISNLQTQLTDLEQSSSDEKALLLGQYDDMVALYDSLGSDYDLLKGQNASLDSLLAQKEQENFLLRSEIDQLKSKADLSAEEIAKLQALLEDYKTTNEGYLAQIEQLVAENEALTASLEEEREKNQVLSAENEYLGEKFVQGSLLQTQNLEITGVKYKKNGKEVTTLKTNKLEQLRVCFETGENKVIEPGPVEMLVRIINPTGVTIVVESLGSGVFDNKDSGEEMQYTKAIQFDYENSNKRICVYWSEQVYESGEYQVEVYQSGLLIGESSVTLK